MARIGFYPSLCKRIQDLPPDARDKIQEYLFTLEPEVRHIDPQRSRYYNIHYKPLRNPKTRALFFVSKATRAHMLKQYYASTFAFYTTPGLRDWLRTVSKEYKQVIQELRMDSSKTRVESIWLEHYEALMRQELRRYGLEGQVKMSVAAKGTIVQL